MIGKRSALVDEVDWRDYMFVYAVARATQYSAESRDIAMQSQLPNPHIHTVSSSTVVFHGILSFCSEIFNPFASARLLR